VAEYRKPQRDATKREIRRLIVEEGLSYQQCIERLKIPRRTFERYVADIFKHDNQLLASRVSDDQIFTQFNICIERLTKQRQDILDGIANNPAADWKARVDAHHLVATIAALIAKMYVDAPSLIAHRHRFPVNSLTAPIHKNSENTGVNLRLKEIKDPSTAQSLRYEHVSESEQEEQVYDELDDPEQQQEEEEAEEEAMTS
jgi:hypothetical protein